MDARLWDTTSTTEFTFWRILNAEKNRTRESLEAGSLPPPNGCLSVFLDLFTDFHKPSKPQDSSPSNKAIDHALNLSSMLHTTSSAFPYNLIHHFAALSTTVLVEALRKPDRKDEVLTKLQLFHQALQNGEVIIAAGDRWITPLKNWLAASIQHHLGGSGANGATSGPDRAGLQHLADAAVGETEMVGGEGVESRGSSIAPKGYLTLLARFV